MVNQENGEMKALLIIDIINHFQFEDGDKLREQTIPVAEKIAKLKLNAKEHKLPVIYVNDNFKNWHADFRDLVSYCLRNDQLGQSIVELLKPDKDDYHILKPSYSGFYATPLHLLLEQLNVNSLIITGIAGNMCVQFTANDAFMLNYKLYIPADCVASNSIETNQVALEQMKSILKADIRPSYQIKF
ncbi:isochorismatase family cysteine hydrolase [Anaerobacillus isosaccharinicus]|uniref:Cysteine hydrolase n=1 Tax=Anaerobacillus isosaccharinicus TaxID=1532552 RepID=A0A1S2LHG2_9BACI|nr:isochorismatase family cysteine hydrolase [Anaerobacillus isosaccharinicus]MBA5588381.1 cysteine hydrolase [Anaerobacillus isosaccharinicus]QOY38187.1 cysteine hydrolase [Anaerobacillus isosaccharinicus]